MWYPFRSIDIHSYVYPNWFDKFAWKSIWLSYFLFANCNRVFFFQKLPKGRPLVLVNKSQGSFTDRREWNLHHYSDFDRVTSMQVDNSDCDVTNVFISDLAFAWLIQGIIRANAVSSRSFFLQEFNFPTLELLTSRPCMHPAGNCFFKVNNRNTRARREICSKS